MDMATKHPRLQILLEKPLYNAVASLADEDGVSMSTKARDLIKEALDHLEDMVLASLAEERAKKPAKPLTLREARKRLGV
jgi:predicted DNA-binding protein